MKPNTAAIRVLGPSRSSMYSYTDVSFRSYNMGTNIVVLMNNAKGTVMFCMNGSSPL